MGAYVERCKKWARGRGESWGKGGILEGAGRGLSLPFHGHLFLSSPRLIRLGNAFKPQRESTPSPIKSQGVPTEENRGEKGREGGGGNCVGARGAPLERIRVIKPFEGRGRRGYKLFLSHVLSLHSICWSNQLFILLPWAPASRRNSLPQSQNISWRYRYTVKSLSSLLE